MPRILIPKISVQDYAGDADRDVIPVSEAAPISGYSDRAFRKHCLLGNIPQGVWWKVGSSYRVSRSALLNWRNTGTVSNHAAAA